MNIKNVLLVIGLSIFVPAFAQSAPEQATTQEARATTTDFPNCINVRMPSKEEPIKFFRALVSWRVKSIELSWDCDQEVFQSLSITDKQISESTKTDIDTQLTGTLNRTTSGASYKITDKKKVGARMGGSFNFSRALIPSRIFNFNIGGDTSWEKASESVKESGNKAEEKDERTNSSVNSSRIAALIEAVSQYTSKTRISKLNLIAEIEFYNNTGEDVVMDELLVPIFADGSKLGDAYEETKKVRTIRYRRGKPITINFRCDLDSTRSRNLSSGNVSAALEQSTGTIKTRSGIDILSELAGDSRLYLVDGDNVGEFHFHANEGTFTARTLLDAFNKQCSRDIDSEPLITYDKDSKFYLKSAGGNTSGDDGFWCIRSVEGNETLALDDEIYPGDNLVIFKAEPKADWIETAAKGGDASAQYWLGNCYLKGIDIAQDPTEATNWFKKSAEKGNARAQCALGICYNNGNGVGKNAQEAFNWFKKSAEQENAEACYYVGLCFYLGKGTDTNLKEAEENLLKSAERGNSDAQYFLGLLYFTGEGITKNIDSAKKWLNRAAAQGNTEAQKFLKEMLTPEQSKTPTTPTQKP